MKIIQLNIRAMAIFLLLVLLSTRAVALSVDQKAIKSVIQDYEKALNDSDLKSVLSLYAKNGVFMPSKKPTAVGLTEIETAYRHIFKAIDLNIAFKYDNIESDGELAYVQTTSFGDIKIIAKNLMLKNSIHRELFVLVKENGKWKISQYMFNSPSKP